LFRKKDEVEKNLIEKPSADQLKRSEA